MYGEGSKLRYIVGFSAVIVLLFVVIFLIVHSGNGKSKVPATQKALSSYSDDSNVTVSERIVGPTTAAQNHHELEIDVTSTQATINVIDGYDGNIVNTRSYPMTTDSFGEFLSALDKAGYTKGNDDAALKDDSGYCATGQRYIFEIRDGSNMLQRYWTTSCGGTKTYKGNRSATLDLFQNQIPDFDDLTSNVDFSSNSFSL